MTYVWLDRFFDFHAMINDVYKRPFITAGFTAFVLMVPLALTSTSGMIRRLGGRRWQNAARLIYVSAIAGAIHYYWLVKIRRDGAAALCGCGRRFCWLPSRGLLSAEENQAASGRAVRQACRGVSSVALSAENAVSRVSEQFPQRHLEAAPIRPWFRCWRESAASAAGASWRRGLFCAGAEIRA